MSLITFAGITYVDGWIKFVFIRSLFFDGVVSKFREKFHDVYVVVTEIYNY